MSTQALEDDPNHWRRRADEARRLANGSDDPIAKTTLQEIALSYERLAALAKARRYSQP